MFNIEKVSNGFYLSRGINILVRIGKSTLFGNSFMTGRGRKS